MTRRSSCCTLAAALVLSLALASQVRAESVAAPVVAPLGESLSPLASLPEATPWSGPHGTRQHRAREAESKARAGMRMQKGAGADTSAKAMADFDVRWYRLALDLNPTTQILTGTTTVEAVVTNGPLSLLHLNLGSQVTTSAARSGGAATTFSWSGGILAVVLDRAYDAGEKVTVDIDYAGNPAGSYFGWSTFGGQPLIWTLSEPYGARVWWPCKDLNTDKADSVALDVTVPSNLVVASNGVLTGVTTPSAGKKTYHWRERYPIAPYLVSLAIHPYAIINDTYYPDAGGTMPGTHYVVPS